MGVWMRAVLQLQVPSLTFKPTTGGGKYFVFPHQELTHKAAKALGRQHMNTVLDVALSNLG